MIDRAALLRDLKPQLRLLEDDLRQRSADVPEFDETLHLEWEDAKQSNRTAATYESWLDDRVTQSAVAWILATVFIRFCEDNGLIDLPVIAGPGDRLAIAGERQNEFLAENRAKTDRDWILQGIEALSVSKVAAGLFDEAHNPMWTVTPSHDAAKALLAFWRRRAESGEIVHDFTDPDWNTRFLGDLYQDLSEHAKKTYALLQTPEFVEEFILDYTLTPAIEEFGLTPDPPEARPDLPSLLRVIDPTCGSGHFLLGAFHRLLEQWEKKAPDADRWEQISRALSSVHGVDKNPFAAAIARFRLLIAAMKAAGEKRLEGAPISDQRGGRRLAPAWPGRYRLQGEFLSLTTRGFRRMHMSPRTSTNMSNRWTWQGSEHIMLLSVTRRISVSKDKRESENYRAAFPICSGSIRPDRAVCRELLPARDSRRNGRSRSRVCRSDHFKLIHQKRVREEARRAVFPNRRSFPYYRHLGRIHSRARSSYGDIDRQESAAEERRCPRCAQCEWRAWRSPRSGRRARLAGDRQPGGPGGLGKQLGDCGRPGA